MNRCFFVSSQEKSHNRCYGLIPKAPRTPSTLDSASYHKRQQRQGWHLNVFIYNGRQPNLVGKGNYIYKSKLLPTKLLGAAQTKTWSQPDLSSPSRVRSGWVNKRLGWQACECAKDSIWAQKGPKPKPHDWMKGAGEWATGSTVKSTSAQKDGDLATGWFFSCHQKA